MKLVTYLRHLQAHLRLSWAWILAGLIALAAVGGYAYVRSTAAGPATVTVHPKEFVQEVSLSGKVIAGSDVDLGFAAGGRISRVYVKVGQTVGAGQLLAETENGDLHAAVAQRQAALDRERAKLAALQAGTRPESLAVSQAALASAEDSLAQKQQALLDAIQSAYAAADDAVHNKIDLFITDPRTINPSLDFMTSNSSAASVFLTERSAVETQLRAWQTAQSSLSAQGDLSSAVDDARMRLTAVSRLLAEANTLLNIAIATPSVPAATISTWISSVSTGRTAIDASISALTTADTAATAAATALVTAQKNLALAQAGATKEDIDAQQAAIAAAAADVASAQAQLGKTLITAPFSGIVTKADAKVGSVAVANVPQVSLESRGAFQIEGYVPEINVSLVKAGQPASVTLDAYGDKTLFGATVASVDPAETLRDGVSTYRVVLQFDTADNRIKSGMTANLSIIADRREGVLSVPMGAVSVKDTDSYVTVIEGKKTSERLVTTGAVSSLGEVEILSGLSDGDQVVLPAAQ